MKAIVVTGSVCSGKSTVAKKIAKKYNYKYVNVNKLVKEKKMYEGYDEVLKSYVVDERKLVKFLIKLIDKSRKRLVIDSHMAHYLPKNFVEVCVVTKCDLKVLKKRLKKRNYSAVKIRQNLDAEIFDVCLLEAQEKEHTITIVDTTNGVKEIIL